MLKTFALISRRPDHTRDAFRAHYEEVHAPLALPLMRGITRYARFHIADELHGAPPFDVISCFVYARGEDAAASVASFASDEGAPIRADEQSFMLRDEVEILVAPPKIVLGSDPGDEGDAPLFVLVRAPEESAAWLEGYDDRHAPTLLEALEEPTCAIEHTTTPTTPAPPSWHRITQVACAGAGQLAQWVREVEDAGADVCVVATRAHESAIP